MADADLTVKVDVLHLDEVKDRIATLGLALWHGVKRNHPDTEWCGGCQIVREELARYEAACRKREQERFPELTP